MYCAICCQYPVTPMWTQKLQERERPPTSIQSICKLEWPEFIGKKLWLNRGHSSELIPLQGLATCQD